MRKSVLLLLMLLLLCSFSVSALKLLDTVPSPWGMDGGIRADGAGQNSSGETFYVNGTWSIEQIAIGIWNVNGAGSSDAQIYLYAQASNGSSTFTDTTNGKIFTIANGDIPAAASPSSVPYAQAVNTTLASPIILSEGRYAITFYTDDSNIRMLAEEGENTYKYGKTWKGILSAPSALDTEAGIVMYGTYVSAGDSVSIFTPDADGWYNNSQINVSFNSSTGHADLLVNGTSYLQNVSTPYTWETNLSDGNYNFTVCLPDDCSTYATRLNWTKDSAAPIVTGTSAGSAAVNATFTRDVSASDPHLYSLNVTCSQGTYSYYNASVIPSTSATAHISFVLNASQTCQYEACDGHTGQSIANAVSVVGNDSSKSFRWNGKDENTLSVSSLGANAALSTEQEKDRVTFTVTPFDPSKTQEFVLVYKTSARAEYIPSSLYPGWIIDPVSRTWFDMNGASGKVSVFQTSPGTYEIRYTAKGAVRFSSTGALNCVSGSFAVTATAAASSSPLLLSQNYCAQVISTTQGTLFYFGLFALVFCVYLFFHFTVRLPIASAAVALVGGGAIFLTLTGCFAILAVLGVVASLYIAFAELYYAR